MSNNKEINELKIKINELKNKVRENTELQNATADKGEKTRKIVLTHVIISGIGYFAGPIIFPPISLISLIFLCCSTIPGGIIMLRYENKVEKYIEKIKNDSDEIKKCEEILEKLLSQQKQNMESNKIETPTIKEVPVKTNTKTKR